MIGKIVVIALLLVCCLIPARLVTAAHPGVAGTVFNKRFIPEIKPMMTYGQMVKIIGAPGLKVGEERGVASVVRYRWNGGKGSVLNLTVSAGRITEAIVLAPNGHTYKIGRDGKVSDMGK